MSRRPGKFTALALAAAAGWALGGCMGETTVVEPAQQPVKVTALRLEQMRPSVECPSEISTELRDKLTAKLYKPGGFGKGSAVKLAYRIVEFDAGGEGSRWSINNLTGKGEGALAVEAVYLDRNGHTIAKVRSEGKVGSSLLGHSMDDAVEKVAEELADYTEKTFK